VDIRTGAAAAASIAASYLREQHVDPGVKLATAILYGIRTETVGSETAHSALDRAMIRWLSSIADPSLLAEISNAPLELEYFSDLALAMQSAAVYGHTAICFLPQALGAEIVGEVADLLIRGRGIHSVFCAAVLGEDLVISARTDRQGGDAATLLRTTIGDLGGCGGHTHRAGGKIPGIAAHDLLPSTLIAELRVRWLRANHVAHTRGEPLVARRDAHLRHSAD
jgi:nanoRNase/pAp phosphatase (c-di-AMP/oligoRNAs hydrolase)